jgi:hypothetical protein
MADAGADTPNRPESCKFSILQGSVLVSRALRVAWLLVRTWRRKGAGECKTGAECQCVDFAGNRLSAAGHV